MRKLVVEAIGTFFLVLTIGLCVLDPGGAGGTAPLAIGAALMVMVYAGGHISGAHYNPAVTLAIFIRKKATAADLVGYWIAQVIGASLAALAVRAVRPAAVTHPLTIDLVPVLIAEIVFTFALAWVVLNVATTRGTEGNSYYGLAIGSTVTAGAYSVGNISGGVFNPAVAVGLTIMGILTVSSIWIYLVATLVGGAAAALLFNALDMGNDKATTATADEQGKLRQAGATE